MKKSPVNVPAAPGFSRFGVLTLLFAACVPAAFFAAEVFRAETPAERMAYASRE